MIGKIYRKARRLVRNMVIGVYHIMEKVLPIKKGIIVFESNVGRNYTGNPRYIYEEMVRQGLDKKYTCVWVFEDVSTAVLGNALKIRRTRFRFFYYMAVAQVWVSDSRLPKYLTKRKGNTYIQTWHGTPLKKLALDMDVLSMGGNTNIEGYHNNFVANSRTWDYLISQNGFSSETFKRCFDFKKTMLEIGYPRNDILVNENSKEKIDEYKKQLGLPLDKKIILYAPTWRDDQYYSKGKYKFVTAMDYDKMREALGDEYVMIVKYHYLVKEQLDWEAYKGFIYQYNETQDIAQLYLVSDMLITDYSSVMFDYSILRRPMVFFAYDMDSYKTNLRGFYFDFLEAAPGPIVMTNEEMIAAIKEYNESQWEDKYQAFHDKFNHVDDGQASRKIVQLICEKIGE